MSMRADAFSTLVTCRRDDRARPVGGFEYNTPLGEGTPPTTATPVPTGARVAKWGAR
jgi:hypothetical protein